MERIKLAASHEESEVFAHLNTTRDGLNEEQVEKNRETYGANEVNKKEKEKFSSRLFKAFVNPFTVVLFGLGLFSFFAEVVFANPDEEGYMSVIIISVMVIVSGIIKLVQETKSGNAAESLMKMITTTTSVKRAGAEREEIPLESVVVGDIVYLAAGDMIPADMRMIQTTDLFITQAALTGESVSVEKFSKPVSSTGTVTELPNIAFMGSNVISGSGIGVVVAVGSDTLFGDIAKTMTQKPVKTAFEVGVNQVSFLIIRFMVVMVLLVLIINGLTGDSWMEAILFALAVAVGLTPEMLPMIVTTCLAKGAVAMSKEKTIIKNLNAIQNIGSMTVLCTDKTGTITQDNVVLMYHLDIHGEENDRVLRHAYLNSYHQTGLKNLMDVAIIKATDDEQNEVGHESLRGLSDKYKKIDEIPFDFERRRMSVVVEGNGKTQLITKGAVEEMLSICSHVEYEGQVVPLTHERKIYILDKVEALNEDGMRVVAVAQKSNPSPASTFSVKDEADMVLMGYLAFLDPPKESTAEAIRALETYGVAVKILTGDNDKVTRCVCRQVGLSVSRIVLGTELEEMSDEELSVVAEEVSVFAKLSPSQKARVIAALRKNGHSVGYMGDGINDAPAMKASDVGISVDTAVDIAKESADVILLEKNLMVLEKGIIEGRKTYANMIKYIKMTASSNFGNIFAMLIASATLPFLPMMPVQLIILNLIYDLTCTAIPWDNVDKEFIQKPRNWDASSIGRFMLWIGPTSSVFDITTFALLFFVIAPYVAGGSFASLTDPVSIAVFIGVFHAGWFVESMWTQTLVIHMIRTPKLPFIKSRASAVVSFLTFVGITVGTLIPFTVFGRSLGLVALPYLFWPWLMVMVMGYMVLVTLFKNIFIKKNGELL